MRVLHALAEGGQTWAHRWRMIRQVIKIAMSLALVIGLIIFAINMKTTAPLLVTNGWYYLKAETLNLLGKEVEVSKLFWETATKERISGLSKRISPQQVIKITRPRLVVLMVIAKQHAGIALNWSFASFAGILSFFFLRGILSRRQHHISGKKIASPLKIRLMLYLKNRASDLRIASLPLVKDTETQHILVTGGTGSGKTNLFHHLLPQIRRRKNKAIIVDTTGVFIERYFDASKDVILNPFEKRGAAWHPWAECDTMFDYESLAESFIPHTHHDAENYWRSAARALFSALLQQTQDIKRTSELTRWVLMESLDRLADFVQGTQAAAHIDPHSERTAASIRSVASSFLNSLEYIKDTNEPFSIKKWIARDDDSWLFLYCLPPERSALTPLLTAWISIAVRSLLQLPISLERRLWFIIDELPTLNKIKDLETLITEGRKYGGCGLFSIQSPSQLEDIYGRAPARTMTGNCFTKVVFAEQDPEISEKISKTLGEKEIKEFQEGISYGSHEVRDGVSLNLQTRKMPIVLPFNIQSLEKNNAYIKLPGPLPISKINLNTC